MADIESPAPVSITDGEYSISTDGGANWGEWTGEDGTVADEDQVKVRQTASPGYEATTDAVLTVGGVSDTFSVTTRAPVLTMAVNTASMGGVSPAAGTHTYPSGTEVEITATPADACHTFTGWSGGAAGTENPTTVTVDADMTVTANFAAIQYTVTTTANPDYCGSVSGSGSYSCGGTAILEATANHGYEFAFWTGDTGTDNPLPTGNPLSFTVDGNKTVNAHFRREGVILTGSQTGASVTFTASVLDSDTPLKGKTVKFYARTATTNWALKASGLTLANGICTKQLTFGTGYWYVKAECQATPSYKMISNEMDFPVGPVLLVFPVTGYVTTDSTPSVGWEPYPGALGYTVQVSSTIYFRPLTTSAAPYGPEVTSCGLAGIVGPFPRGVRKYWRVIAVLQTGTSLPSKYRAVTYKEAGQLINLDLQATATSVKPTVRLVDSIGGSIAGKYVYFYYKAESSSSWLSMGSDLTDANGVAVLGTAKKLAAGGYEIKAAFKGTTTYAPCESVEAVQVGVPG
ncbi:MAG TPA: hypothetical protein VJO15_07540 [Dehalococcoidia bacterium]|nr:hypothetical protein [Dehalococcoidia bacterium]